MNLLIKKQRRNVSPLINSLVKGSVLGLSMTMLIFVPSLLAQPNTSNSNYRTTLPLPTNDNNSIPGAEINFADNRIFTELLGNQSNSMLVVATNDLLPHSNYGDHHSLNNTNGQSLGQNNSRNNSRSRDSRN